MGIRPGTATEESLYVNYVKVLFTDLGAMHSLLSEISPKFVVCHRYDEMGKPESVARVASFVSPSEEVAKMVATSMIAEARPHAASSESLPFTGAEYMQMRLQRKLDVVDATYCR